MMKLAARKTYCKKFCSFVSVLPFLSTSQDPVEAIEPIKKHQPDVVFLDKEILGMSGLRMA